MKIHAFLSHLTGKQAYFSKHRTKKLLKRLDEIMPDVVHLHNLHHNYVNLNMLLSYLGEKNIKTVLTLHDCWFFTGKCTHYAQIGCEKWKQGCGDCPLLESDNKSWFFDRTDKIWKDKKKYFERIDKLEVVGVSKWISEQARKSFLKCGSITTIHNGIDIRTFIPEGEDLRKKLGLEDKFVILGMANKWLNKLNEGIFEQIEKCFGDACCILLVGVKEVKKGNVICLDYVKSRDDLAKIYRTADVFVNVTHADSLPTVNLEAMACGVPVVTYDVCGSTETITEKTGIAVQENDTEKLIDAINEIKMMGMRTFSYECRDHILKNYNADLSYEKYINIYER